MNKYRDQIQTLHNQLGIPPDYEQRYCLPLCHEVRAVVEIGHDIAGRPCHLTAVAFEQWQVMKKAAEQDDVELQVVSAFRSVERQAEIIRHKLEHGQNIEEILRINAAPGYSEHHTGNALDLTTPGFRPLEEEFEISDAFRWLQQNAHRFSFVLSYPRDNRHKIAYEPWHWAYLPDGG
jgi:D-alanyl-D-alanine carboxypeptidase